MDDPPAAAAEAELFDEGYYRTYCGEVPYEADAPRWRDLFEGIAARIVSDVGPATVLDAGCALGLLVHALRRRGVEAWGVDVSAYAVAQAPAPARPYCRVGSLLDPAPAGAEPGKVDLVVCIEVLEHLPREQAEAAVARLCERADDVLFSSSPIDFREPTHRNVEPIEAWAERFARHGFVRDLELDATFVSPWAVRFRRRVDPWPRVVRGWERAYARAQAEVADLRAALVEARDARERLGGLERELERARRTSDALLGSSSWRLTAPLRDAKEALRALARGRPRPGYEMWLRLQGEGHAARTAAWAASLPRRPVVSVIVPVCDPPVDLLERALASVRAQHWPAWELCIADDASRLPAVRALLEAAAEDDPRVRVAWRRERGHISAASNDALALATGEWCTFLDHDDELAPHALAGLVAEAEAHPDVQLVFSDEDKLDASGWRRDPVLKPGWDVDHLRGCNYVCHLAAYRTARVRSLGGLRVGLEGAQDHDLALRYTEGLAPCAVRRLPLVLYRWRAWAGSTASSVDAKPYAGAACRRAVRDHLDRLGARADVLPIAGAPTMVRVRWGLPSPAPRVALVLVARHDDEVAALPAKVAGLRESAGLPLPLVVIADARARADAAASATLEALLRDGLVQATAAPAPWAAAGQAVERALGACDVVALLDASVITDASVDGGWLAELVAHACRPDVGAAAPLLVDAQGAVASAGVSLGPDGRPFRPLAGLPANTGEGDGRAHVARTVTAAPGACLVLRADAWRRAGGLESGVPLADVELCLRLADRGLRVVWSPFARLVATAPVLPSVGVEDASRLKTRWPAVCADDPRWSPALACADGPPRLAWPPRARFGDPALWR